MPSNDEPSILHQIWVGSEPPGWVRTNWERWDRFMALNHPDWEVRRWTTAEDAVFERIEVWRDQVGPRGLADLMRVEAVNALGGVYMDSDTVPIRPLAGLSGGRAWVGTFPESKNTNRLINSSFGFPAGHPFLESVVARASGQLVRGVRNDHHVAGPFTFYRAWRSMPGAVDIEYTWPTIDDSDLLSTMKKRGEYDEEALRQRFPEARVLHMLVNYGTWKGRRA